MRDGLNCSEAGRLGGLAAAKTLNAMRQNKRNLYLQNPKLCKNCNKIIDYKKRTNDFCNHSCSAEFNNKLRNFSTVNKIDNCLFCNKPLEQKGQHKYCSRDCMTEFHWVETKTKLISEGIDNSDANRIGKKYLIELHNGKCQICDIHEWCGRAAPLVLDHINGNPYDNALNNLRVICHNCNAQTPTFAGSNKGNGRFERAKRYKLEKEVMSDIKADVI